MEESKSNVACWNYGFRCTQTQDPMENFCVTEKCRHHATFPKPNPDQPEFFYVNLTPHVVRLNDGREFPPSGVVARVATTYSEFDRAGRCTVSYGKIENLPGMGGGPGHPGQDTIYIVSLITLAAVEKIRYGDVVAPASNHPKTVRDENGQIYSVPGFVCLG